MSESITQIYQRIITLKQQRGTKLLIQKLQQKIDKIKRHASDTQATNKTD